MSFIAHMYFQTNADVHSIKTWNIYHLQRPTADLSSYNTSMNYTGNKIFNSLP